METLAELYGGGAAMFSQAMGHGGATIHESARFDPQAAQTYQAYYSRTKPWLAKIDTVKAGGIVTGGWLIDEHSYRKSEYFNDWLRPQGFYYLLGAIVLKDAATTTVTTIIRSRRAGDFAPAEPETCRRLVPHLQRAVRVHAKLADARLERDGATQTLDALATGVILTEQCSASAPLPRWCSSKTRPPAPERRRRRLRSSTA
jgi:hypothetical protein